MSYVDSQLVEGESIRYRAHLSKVMFAAPYAVAALGMIFAIEAFATAGVWILALSVLALAALVYGWCQLVYSTSEFAVTNKRVIIKVGWVTRRTVETMLSKVEGIGVDQDLVGRLLNYGSIVVTGTGGTKEAFTRIANPLEFRRQVQAAISVAEGLRSPVAALSIPSGGPGAGAEERVERDCPYCAERILLKAKVCKHCGRNVSVTTAT